MSQTHSSSCGYFMTEIGVAIDGRAPITQAAAQARAAEDGGAGTLWIACHLFLRDPITTAAVALSATRRISVALMAMSPFSVHPVFTAMAGRPFPRRLPCAEACSPAASSSTTGRPFAYAAAN